MLTVILVISSFPTVGLGEDRYIGLILTKDVTINPVTENTVETKETITLKKDAIIYSEDTDSEDGYSVQFGDKELVIPSESVQLVDELTTNFSDLVENVDSLNKVGTLTTLYEPTKIYNSENNSVGELQVINYPIINSDGDFYKIIFGNRSFFIDKKESNLVFTPIEKADVVTPNTPTESDGSVVSEEQQELTEEKPVVEDVIKEENEEVINKNEKKNVVSRTSELENSKVSTFSTKKAENVFTQDIRYFKVVPENVPIYDNRSGSLVEVGYLKKGEVYPRTNKNNSQNWHEIKFGDFTGYVRVSSTEPANGSQLSNENTSSKIKNETITFNSDTEVYDNTSGSLVPFAVMPEGLEYPILRHAGNWYLIDVSGRYGYVRKSEVSSDFTETMKYFEVTADKLDVYDNETGKLIKIGTVVKGQTYPRVSDYGNWHQIKFGDRFGYVRKAGTRPNDNSKIKNENTKYKNSKHKVMITKGASVFDNSSGKLVAYATIVKGQSYPIISDFGNWWEIDVSGRVGYISKQNSDIPFTEDIEYFTVKVKKLQVYDNRGNSLKEVGKLLKGETYPRIKDYGNWHQIQFGDYYGYVKKAGTEAVIEADIKNVSKNTNRYVAFATTKRSVAVYDNTGNKLEAFGLINPNQKYPILSTLGKWIKINYSGRVGYILSSEIVIHKPSNVNLNLVNPHQVYSYTDMANDIKELKAAYPGLIQTKVIGKSVDGRNLYALKLGKGKTEIMLNSSHHAREYMTTNILMEMIDQYAQSYNRNSTIGGYKTRNILNNASIWFVPMVNPDGVMLVQEGHNSAKNPSNVLKINGGSTNFSSWKANIRGVDLNRQYPAGWNTIVGNPGKPSPQNYKGSKPLSEPETKAMYNFANNHSFKTAVSYHSSGEIIYWNYKTPASNVNRDKKIAEMIRNKTGYSLVAPKKNPSGGGFTDWFIYTHKKPAFTPEISPYVGNRPVPLTNFNSIWAENNSIGLMLAEEAYKNRNNR